MPLLQHAYASRICFCVNCSFAPSGSMSLLSLPCLPLWAGSDLSECLCGGTSRVARLPGRHCCTLLSPSSHCVPSKPAMAAVPRQGRPLPPPPPFLGPPQDAFRLSLRNLAQTTGLLPPLGTTHLSKMFTARCSNKGRIDLATSPQAKPLASYQVPLEALGRLGNVGDLKSIFSLLSMGGNSIDQETVVRGLVQIP